MSDATMIPTAETVGCDDLPEVVDRPRDRADLLRLGQLLVLGVAVVLVVTGALAVLELVSGLLDGLALGPAPQ